MRGRRKQLAGVVVSPGTAEASLPLMASLKADLHNCVFLLAISEKWSKEKKQKMVFSFQRVSLTGWRHISLLENIDRGNFANKWSLKDTEKNISYFGPSFEL